MQRFHYVDEHGQTAGPVTMDDLRQLRGSSRLADATPVIEEGGSSWGTFASHNAAHPIAPRPMAPPPPVVAARPYSAPPSLAAPAPTSAPVRSARPAMNEPGVLLRVAANPVLYVVGYLMFMIPTYILPYFGSNSHILGAAAAAINDDMGNHSARGLLRGAFLMHLICLGVLVALAFVRGKRIGKNWLVLFPGLALAFDMLPVLTLIPLVPTIMHLLAIILGVVGASRVATAQA